VTLAQRYSADDIRTAVALAGIKLSHTPKAPDRPPYTWQVPPPQPWDVWLLLGGRGTGKTEAGARYVNEHANGEPCLEGKTPHRIAIVAPSHDDAVNTCVRGETGLLFVNRSIRFHPGAQLVSDLTWPNGTEAALFGTFAPEDVERFRGPQHCLIWGDEFAAWRKLQESWDMLQPGLRLGPHPHMILTTTPKRRPLLRSIMAEPGTRISTGKTLDAYGLPEARRAALYERYGGTVLGRQELDAEIIEDVAGAMWSREMIAHGKPPEVLSGGKLVPDMARLVVAVDPAATSGEDADETGIVVAGLAHDGRGYVFADGSSRLGPNEWAARVVRLYRDYGADRIVAEANNGGEMVRQVIRQHDPSANVVLVHATKGKTTRAEPVSALYARHKVVHVENLPELEDQMCSYTGAPGEKSPDRMDALVWALTDLLVGSAWGSGLVASA
jgi:predicted phage terminase large subunit-like protein